MAQNGRIEMNWWLCCCCWWCCWWWYFRILIILLSSHWHFKVERLCLSHGRQEVRFFFALHLDKRLRLRADRQPRLMSCSVSTNRPERVTTDAFSETSLRPRTNGLSYLLLSALPWPCWKTSWGHDEEEVIMTIQKTTVILRESECTYPDVKASVIDLCQVDWLLLHGARNCGAFHVSFPYIGTISVVHCT